MDTFQNYCIVCDRLIAAAALPETKGKKKAAAGAIRIKNPDGSTTTRTADGVKTTRPALRASGGAAKLAAAAAKVNGTAAPTPPPRSGSASSGSGSGSDAPVCAPVSIPAETADAASPVSPSTTPDDFKSDIYCSRDCATKDGAAAPADLTRAFGVGFTYSDALVAAGLHISPNAPPSPLLGSDTDSTSSPSLATAARGLARTPEAEAKGFDFFRVPRDAPDDAWREIERQRRSSNARADTAANMSRQRSSTGSGLTSTSGASSDSLASLWGEHDVVHRSMSKSGMMRAMTPMDAGAGASDISIGSARRSMSSSSDGSGIQRPLARSTLSHSSLGGLSSPGPVAYPPEVGSAPSATALMMHSYASAFVSRDCFSPASGAATPSDGRSNSVSIAPIPRPSSTRTGRSRTGSQTSWDAFGKAEMMDRSRSRRGTGASDVVVGSLPRDASSPDLSLLGRRGRGSVAGSYSESTPKQSLECDQSGWQIRFMQSPAMGVSAARTRSRSRSAHRGSATRSPLPIPARALPSPALASSTSTARGSARGSVAGSHTALPDLAAMHIGASAGACAYAASAMSASAAAASAAGAAAASAAGAASTLGSSPKVGSVPKAGFDWDARGQKTYALPPGVVVNPNKGLFYFNV